MNNFYMNLYYAIFYIKFEIYYLHRGTKLIWADPGPFVALLHSFKLYYYTKNYVLIHATLQVINDYL
jgi:hypothetical protein